MLRSKYYVLFFVIYAMRIEYVNMFAKNMDERNTLLELVQIESRSPPPDGLFVPQREMKFTLYSQIYKNGVRLYNDETLKMYVNFIWPIKLLTHGYSSNCERPVCLDIKEAYLEKGNYNVILVDWKSMAKIYTNAIFQIKGIAQVIASFIQTLIHQGADPNGIHLVGHSLGAHIVGVAGRLIQNVKIGRVTGLDPAGPMFQLVERDKIIGNDSAQFVDVIHTSRGVYGYDGALGTVDFYPNGGITQPGCSIFTLPLPSCDHARSWKYFAESIQNNTKFPAKKCSSYYHFYFDMCKLGTVYMGEAVEKTAKGDYYLQIKL